jgi:transcriptional regulator with XRE-family HTH domain
MDTTNKAVAARIKKIRLEQGLTQAQLAEKAGVYQNTYAKFERGETKPTLDFFKRIAKALNLPSTDLFNW